MSETIFVPFSLLSELLQANCMHSLPIERDNVEYVPVFLSYRLCQFEVFPHAVLSAEVTGGSVALESKPPLG